MVGSKPCLTRTNSHGSGIRTGLRLFLGALDKS